MGELAELKSIADRMNFICHAWSPIKSPLRFGLIDPIHTDLSKIIVWFEWSGKILDLLFRHKRGL